MEEPKRLARCHAAGDMELVLWRLVFMPGSGWAVALTLDPKIHTLLRGRCGGRRKDRFSKPSRCPGLASGLACSPPPPPLMEHYFLSGGVLEQGRGDRSPIFWGLAGVDMQKV